MSATFTALGLTRAPLLLRVEIHHLGGAAVSKGQASEKARMSVSPMRPSVLMGPLAGQSFLLRGLPRGNLTEPVAVPMVGELRRAEPDE